MVFFVKGRVGLVEERRTFGIDAMRMMSSMAAAGTFGMVRVDGASGNGSDGVFDEAGFVDGVGVNGDLNVEVIGHAEAGIDGSGG